MTPQELKSSILQLAIQGKLVEQRPEEGTAEELYRKIQEEKKRLIKEGKIKKEKPLPEIVEDEKPFEIPENWTWVRFGNVISLVSGTDFKPEEYNDQGRGTIYITGASNLSDNGVIILRWTETPRNFAYRGDILLVCKGSGYGKTVFCDVDEAHIARQIMAIKRMDTLNMSFIRYFLQANIYYLKTKGQGVIPGIDRASILNMFLPIPPIKEQKRIVAKIEELLPYIDRYEQAWNRLEDFNKRFPIDMQKSLLQMAIQGQLVEQRAEEGAVEDVYPEIQGEPPFEIPQNWKWVRLSDIIVEKPSNGLSPKGVNYETKVKNLTLTATTSGKFKPDAFKYVDIDLEPDSKYWLKNGDLLIQRSNSRELVGTSCVYTGKDNEYIYPDLMMKLRIKDGISIFYVDYVLKAPLSRFYFSKNASGTSESMPKINQRIVSDTLIPLPPIAEQNCIVAKLEELLLLCDRLK